MSYYSNSLYHSFDFTGPIVIDDSLYQDRGVSDVLLIKRDSKGNYLWSKLIGGPLGDSLAGIAVDDQGAVFVGGTFSHSLKIDDSVIHSNGLTDIFIAKFTAAGKLNWLRNIGTVNQESLVALSVDFNNQVRIAGTFSGVLSIGHFNLDDTGGHAFTASFSNNGGHAVYAKTYTPIAASKYIRMDRNGNLYYAGIAFDSKTIGNVVLTPSCKGWFSSYNPVFWAAKLDTAANLLWAKDLVPCDPNNRGVEYYRKYLDFYVDDSGLVYISFIDGAWLEMLGPSPGDPYNSTIRILSSDGNVLQHGYITRFGMPGTADILRYFLYGENKKVLLYNSTHQQIEYIPDIRSQDTYQNALISVTSAYIGGYIDSVENTFYVTGISSLSKLGNLFTANAGADRNICSSVNSTVRLGGSPTAACGQPPYRYRWVPAVGLDSDTSANPMLHLNHVIDSQKYILTVTDAVGTSSVDSVQIIKNNVPVKPVITANNNVLFTASPRNANFQWFLDGSILQGANKNVLAFQRDGKYQVKVTEGNLCSSLSDTFYAFKIILNAGRDTGICKGTMITLGGSPTALTASGNLVYEWSPSSALTGNTIANPVATPDSNTIFKLVVRDSFGNNAFDSVFIRVHPVPTPTVSQNENVLHSGYFSGNQWFLNGQPIDNATEESLSIQGEGEYFVRVTDSLGCSGTSEPYSAKMTELNLSVFPSPVSSFLNISYNLPNATAVTIEVFNISTGIRKTLMSNVKQPAGSQVMTIKNIGLSKGIYLVRVSTSEGSATDKFIVL